MIEITGKLKQVSLLLLHIFVFSSFNCNIKFGSFVLNHDICEIVFFNK
jgi:hypothetical protein